MAELLLLKRGRFFTFTLTLIASFFLVTTGVVGQALVQTDKSDYQPGDTVVITGAGWYPEELVELSIKEIPTQNSNIVIKATADVEGKISTKDFVTQQHHLGKALFVTAVGNMGSFAETHFTDASFTSFQSGAWNLGSTWGNPGNNIEGSGYPGIADDVVITDRHLVNLTGNASAKTLQVSGANSGNAHTILNVGTYSLNVSNYITLISSHTNRQAILNVNGGTVDVNIINLTTGTSGNAGNVEFNLNENSFLNLSDVINKSGNSSNLIAADNSTVNFDGTSFQLVNPSDHLFGNIKINNPIGVTFNGNFTEAVIKGNITVESGTLDITNKIISNSTNKAFKVNNDAKLKLNSHWSNIRFSIINLDSHSTVEYNGSDQNVGAVSHGHMIISRPYRRFLTGHTIVRGNLTIESGATLLSGSYSMALQGDFNNQGVFFANIGTTIFDGTIDQSILGGVATFNNLVVNKGSGDIILGNNSVVNGALTLTRGKIITGTNEIKANGSITEGSTSSYIQGNLGRAIATGSNIFNFPIGTAAGYTPAVIAFNNVSTIGTILAKSIDGSHPNVGEADIAQDLKVNRYWDFSNTGVVFSSFDVTTTFLESDKDNGTNFNDFIISNYDGTLWSYPYVGTKTTNSTQAIGLNSFGSFAVGTGRILTTTTVNKIEPIIYGSNSIVLTAIVGRQTGSATINSGTFEFFVDDISVGTTEVSDGSASFTYNPSSLAVNSYEVKAIYSGAGILVTSSSDPENNGTLTVNKKEITGNFTAKDKVYDGNDVAEVLTRTLNGTVSGDEISLTGGSASFANKNVENGKVVTSSGMILSGNDAGNYSLTSVANATADITALEISGAFTADNKIYDGNTDAVVLSRSLVGHVSTDAVTLDGGTASFDNKNKGTDKVVTLLGAGLAGDDAINYTLSGVVTTTADITALEISGAFTADDKIYDGNTDAVVLSRSLVGHISTDAVTLNGGTAAFDNKNVANGKTVTLSGAGLAGDDAINYTLSGVATTTANITALEISGAFTADDKIYDGNTSATVTGYSVATKVGTDDVNISGGTATFSDANAAPGKTVTLTGATLTGAAANNYSLTSVNTATADIDQLGLVGSFTASDKTYDGNTSATVTGYSVATKIGEDDVNISGGTATFSDENAVPGKTVTLTGATLTGAAANNYSLTSVNTATADIDQLGLVGSFTASDKTYDGNTSATVTGYSVATKIGEDDVNISGGTATFSDASAAEDKTVTLTGAALTGAAASNYSLTSVNTATADIDQLGLVGSFTASDKTYDGNTSATVTGYTVATKVGTDDVNISGGTATFSDASAAEDKTVTLTGAALTGAAANNYSLTSVNTATADIDQLGLVGSFTASDKTYDGNTSATVTGYSVATKIGEDDVNISGGTATFSDANAAPGKTVTLTGATLTGAAANNYSLTSVNTATADIDQLGLVGSFTASDKTYDGNTSATVTGYSVATKVGTDDVNISGGTAAFSDASAAEDKTVTLTGAALTGAAANNYSLTSVNTATADIDQLGLVGSFTASDKTYDGNTSATVTGYSVATKVGTDDVNISGGTATFSDASAAPGKTVTLTGATLTGAAASNYSLTSVNTATAEIQPASLTITAPDLNKFCGQVDPVGSCLDCSEGLIEGEVVNVDYSVIDGEVVPVIAASDHTSFNLANYNVTPINGILTIDLVTLDVTNSQSPRSINEDVIISIIVTDGASNLSGVLVKLIVGSTTKETTSINGVATFNFGKLASGLYPVTAQAGGCTATEAVFLPVYDPNGGFVTGGGWIESPAGASKLFPEAFGRANFGFNAKYKTGRINSNEIDGHTNFQFKAGDLHFSSLLHHNLSLVVSGPKATYTGEGTINGIGSYEFRLIAIDGDLVGSTTKDKFRIKIWTKGNPSDVVYDNERLALESADATTDIAGGSIVIHKPKANNKTAEVVEKIAVTASVEPVVEILESMAVAPNPVREEARVRFSLIEDANVVLRVFDFNGREVERLFSGSVRAHEVKEVSFQRRNLMSGVYILKLTTDRGNSYDKQIIVE